MSSFLKRLEAENAAHTGGGGSVASVQIGGTDTWLGGDQRIKIDTCVDGNGDCHHRCMQQIMKGKINV